MDFSLSIIARRTLDTGNCLDILLNEEIFNAISEDDATINDLRVDVINDYWVDLVDGEIIIGVAQFKAMFNKCYDAHIHILPEHRKKHSLAAGDALIKWCEDNIKGSLLFTTIPEFCPNVVEFLLAFDFQESGLLVGAWKKNGKQNNMKILTRSI